MKQQPGIGSPKLSVGRFFYMIGIDIQIGLIMLGAASVLIGVPAGAGFALAHSSPFAVPVAVIIGLIGIGVVIFLSFRFSLAPTLAVCAAKPVIKNSWHLMKGNCWRLFGNGILLMFVCVLFGIIVGLIQLALGIGIAVGGHALLAGHVPVDMFSTQPFFARYFTPTPGTIDAQIKLYIRTVFDTFNMCLINGIVWAFYAAAVRVFYEEKRANDPAFTLVASS